MGFSELDTMTKEDLVRLAREEYNISAAGNLKRQDLVLSLLQAQAEQDGNSIVTGMLEVGQDGYGFLKREGVIRGADDIYISQSQVRRFGLLTGDMVMGIARPPKEGEKYQSLLRIELVNGVDPELASSRTAFDRLTPVFPNQRFDLEADPRNLCARIINLVAPIGRGQRGLIVSPPKAGKTVLLKRIANAIATNYGDVHIMVCLIGERPEEVTDMQRSTQAEVISATFDQVVENQTRTAELALARAKRLVESNRDVVVLLDGITRLTRAYNQAAAPSGRTLSGGIDPAALYQPKRFFGSARNLEEGGSLTILATCLVDTGSRMDEVIFEEFKGTGNWELHLDRRLAERRIFPAIDIQRSSTRREELLLDEDTLQQVWLLRRMMAMITDQSGNPVEATERVLNRIARSRDNAEFLATLKQDL